MEEILVVPHSTTTTTTTTSSKQQQQQSCNNLERKLVRPQKEQAYCPRCNSTNTKFCYYNNYSLSQPRYFCKTCRRYWTEGGSLRNIPVGGGSRKNKRSSSSSSNSTSPSSTSNSCSSTTSSSFLVSSSSSSSKQQQLPDLILPPISPHHLLHHPHQNPNSNSKMIYQHHDHGIHGQDLNLGFSSSTAPLHHHHHHHHHDFKTITELIQVPNFDINGGKDIITTSTATPTTTTSSSCHLSALELLTGITNPRGLNSFLPMPIQGHDIPSSVFSASSGILLPEFKPSSLSFSLDGLGINNNGGGSTGGGGGGYGSSSLHSSSVQESSSNGRLLFPFEDLKQVSNTNSADNAGEDRDQHGGDSTGYWTGILGGGGGGGGGGGAW